MAFEHDPTIRTLTNTAKLLTDIAAHRLIAQSDYPELREIASAADQMLPELVTAIGKLQAGRAAKRADD